MLIKGPMSISIVEEAGSAGRELHLSFSPDFQALAADQQAVEFQVYVAGLRAEIGKAGGDERERAGMAMVLQIAEELLPHVLSGDLELGETIVVEMQPLSPLEMLMGGVDPA